MDKVKYFLVLLMILFLSMSFCAASDSDNITQSNVETQSAVDDVTYSSIIQENENIQVYDNNMNNKQDDIDMDTLTENKVVQKKNQDNLKTQENTDITTITEDNYNDYLSISSSGKVTLKTTYFVPKNNYTINLTYFPSDVNKFEVNFYSNNYKNDNLKIIGNGITIEDTNIVINKRAFSSVVLEDVVLNYTPDYTGDYVNVSSAILNNVTINVDTQRNGFSIPLTVSGEKTLVENCTINANVPSTQIDWYASDIPHMPKGVGVWVTSNNVTLANNVIKVNESKVETGNESYYRSIYGIYSSGSYTTLRNNTFILNGTQYSYGIVVRSLNNRIYDNNITVVSEYYAAGINIEGNGVNNNLMCNNFINVSAGFNVTDHGNPDVAYACLILDFSCGGENYWATSNSMCNNSYINNTVICDGRQVYGFELWGGVNTTIDGNNITVTGTLPLGIGAIGINTTMNNNIIFADGTSNSTEGSADYIKPRTAGIYAYGMKEGNTITNNTIAVTKGRALRFESAKNMLVENNFLLSEDYAYVIEVDNINNTFKNNAILGEGTTEEVIKDTNKTNNTYINNREPTPSIMTILAEDSLKVNEESIIVVSLVDEDDQPLANQYITLNMGDDVQTVLTNDEGEYTFTYTPAADGELSITAEYECYGDYGSSATATITVTKYSTNFQYYKIKDANLGDTVKISAKLLSDGQPVKYQDVTVTVNGEDYTAKTSSTGYFTLNYVTATAGVNNITFTYNGNNEYEAVTSTTTFKVIGAKKETGFLYYTIKDVNLGDTVKISAKLLSDGQPVKSQNVIITVNGVEYTAKTSSTGYFVINYVTATAGVNNITFTYNGNNEYEATTDTTTFNVIGDKKETNFLYYQIKDTNLGNTVKISAKLLSDDQPVKSQNVIVTINGEEYTAKTSSTGYFVINYVTTTAGVNNITFTYSGNNEYEATTDTTSFNIIGQKSPTLFQYYNFKDTTLGNSVKISAKLLSEGQPVKYQDVTVTVNCENYSVRTSSTGYFVLDYMTTTSGINNVTFTYNGNTEYDGVTNTTTFNVI